MTLGNDVGFRFNTEGFTQDQLYIDDFGGIVLEVESSTEIDKNHFLGMTQEDSDIVLGDIEISIQDSKKALTETLEPVYSTEDSG